MTPSRVRFTLQLSFVLFCLYVGFELWQHVQWATGQTGEYIPKPEAAEGFLPIAAFMAAKRLLLTGQWDPVHPAGLTIFIAIVCMSLVFRKGFCGNICPVGFVSRLVESAGRKRRWLREIPRKLEYVLFIPKYLILGSFVYFIGFSMNVQAIENFIKAPYNFVADSRMLAFFTSPSTTTIIVLAVLGIISLRYRNFWCRFFCPYGALLGLFSRFSPTAMQRNADLCHGCGKCRKACPSGIRIDEKIRITSPECIGCTECSQACPEKECITTTFAGKAVPFWVIGFGSVAVLLGFWIWAQATGHWSAEIPQSMIRRFHMMFM